MHRSGFALALLTMILLLALTSSAAFAARTAAVPQTHAEMTVYDAYLGVSGMLAYYQFDESGGTLASDSSGNGRDLTLFGETGFVPGVAGNALLLPGLDSAYARRDLDDHVFDFGASDFTIELFVKFNRFEHEQTLVEKWYGSDGPGWTLTCIGSNLLRFAITRGGIMTNYDVNPGFVTDRWYRLAVVREGTHLSILRDGSVILDQPISAAIDDVNMPLLIGKRNEHDTRSFPLDGLIDQVVIWALARTSDALGIPTSGDAGYQGVVTTYAMAAVPGILSIVPGEAWANYVKAAQLHVDYTLKNVVLKKTTPSIIQCADVFPAKTISQQGTPSIRLWWPMMYETAGTVWTLDILYGTPAPWDDDGAGPNPAGYVHREEWKWILETDIPHMQLTLDLFHQLPFGLDEVPLISDETLFSALNGKLDGIRTLVDDKKFTDAGLLLGDFEMEVMDACILVSPARPKPTGPGTGIANTLENPACCKLMADAEYVGKSLGIFQPTK